MRRKKRVQTYKVRRSTNKNGVTFSIGMPPDMGGAIPRDMEFIPVWQDNGIFFRKVPKDVGHGTKPEWAKGG